MFWILLIGFTLRSYLLNLKPVHFDEGINGHFVQSIWRDGFYHYDPTNFHGPLYFYILALTERLLGWGIANFRFVTGLINLAAIWVVGLHRRFVGRTAIYAALILCLSPAYVFYSRYAIHESLFILSQAAFSYGYFLYREEKSTRSLWWMALAIVGLATTKETFIIFLGTWAIAVASVQFFEALFKSYPAEAVNEDPAPPAQNWVAVSMVAVVLILAFFTGFFIYMRGAEDMITAFQVWTHTGTGHTGHEKPAIYWIDLLRRYEWPCLIGLIATPVVFFAKTANRALRILVLAGFGTWMAYSIVPYKTPWLIMNFQWLLAFSAGAVIARVIPAAPYWRGLRTGAAIATFATIFFSGAYMLRLNFQDYANPREPYVYVQSTTQFRDVMNLIFNHIEKAPQDLNMPVFAMTRDPWPMPYLLERMTHLTWGHDASMNLHDADIILSDAEDKGSIEGRLKGRYFVIPFPVRDAYQPGQAYLRESKFKDEVPAGVPVFEGVAP